MTFNPESSTFIVVNSQWMLGITIGIFSAILAAVWKIKSELHDAINAAMGTLREEFHRALGPLRDDIRALGERISGHDQDIGVLKGKYGDARSPMKPNDAGNKLLTDSGFHAAYAALRDRVFRRLDEMGTRTRYDSEVNARVVLEEMKNDPAMDGVKEYVVNHPKEPLELVLSVAAWNIRDEYWDAKSK